MNTTVTTPSGTDAVMAGTHASPSDWGAFVNALSTDQQAALFAAIIAPLSEILDGCANASDVEDDDAAMAFVEAAASALQQVTIDDNFNILTDAIYNNM